MVESHIATSAPMLPIVGSTCSIAERVFDQDVVLTAASDPDEVARGKYVLT
jgi:hypothetical protein